MILILHYFITFTFKLKRDDYVPMCTPMYPDYTYVKKQFLDRYKIIRLIIKEQMKWLLKRQVFF